MSEAKILGSIFAVCLILILVSLSGASVPLPADWLQEWTAWVASVVGIVIAARIFWKGTDAAISFVNFHITKNSKTEKKNATS